MSSTTVESTPSPRGADPRAAVRKRQQFRPRPQLPAGPQLRIHQVPHPALHADPARLHSGGHGGVRGAFGLGDGPVLRGRGPGPGGRRQARGPGRRHRRQRAHLRHRVRPADPGLPRRAADELRVHHGHGPVHVRGGAQTHPRLRGQARGGGGDLLRRHRRIHPGRRIRVRADPGQLRPRAWTWAARSRSSCSLSTAFTWRRSRPSAWRWAR